MTNHQLEGSYKNPEEQDNIEQQADETTEQTMSRAISSTNVNFNAEREMEEDFTSEDNESGKNYEDSYSNQNDDITEVSESNRKEKPSKFEDILFNTKLLKAAQQLNPNKPTRLECQALPMMLSFKDLFIASPTVSERQNVFILGLLKTKDELLANVPSFTGLYALILTHTAEEGETLAAKIKKLDDTCNVACLTGDDKQASSQYTAIAVAPFIAISTLPVMRKAVSDQLLSLDNCRYLVVEALDEMLSDAEQQEMRSIFSRLPDMRQSVFTCTSSNVKVEMLAHNFLHKPRFISGETDAPVEHFYINVGNDSSSKAQAISELVESHRPFSALIYCSNRSDSSTVEAFLRRRGYEARRINSELSPRQKRKVCDKLRAQEVTIICATENNSGQGVGIDGLDMIVNYSIPETSSNYIKKAKGAGRLGKRARIVTLVSGRELDAFEEFRSECGITMEELHLPAEHEVTESRIARFYEIIRREKLDLSSTDIEIAQKLYSEISSTDPENRDFVRFLAKIAKYIRENYVTRDAMALEDEIVDKKRDTRQPRKLQGDRDMSLDKSELPREQSRSRRDSSNKASRNDSADLPHSIDEDEESESRRSTSEASRTRSDSSRSDRPRSDSRSARTANRPEKENPATQKVRVFIGQGTSRGMTEDEFLRLSLEFGELEESDILQVVMRENYGYVDLYRNKAKTLIENLNGIEYNGESLAVEMAKVLNKPETASNPAPSRPAPDREFNRAAQTANFEREQSRFAERQERDSRYGERGRSSRGSGRGNGNSSGNSGNRAPRNGNLSESYGNSYRSSENRSSNRDDRNGYESRGNSSSYRGRSGNSGNGNSGSGGRSRYSR